MKRVAIHQHLITAILFSKLVITNIHSSSYQLLHELHANDYGGTLYMFAIVYLTSPGPTRSWNNSFIFGPISKMIISLENLHTFASKMIRHLIHFYRKVSCMSHKKYNIPLTARNAQHEDVRYCYVSIQVYMRRRWVTDLKSRNEGYIHHKKSYLGNET